MAAFYLGNDGLPVRGLFWTTLIHARVVRRPIPSQNRPDQSCKAPLNNLVQNPTQPCRNKPAGVIKLSSNLFAEENRVSKPNRKRMAKRSSHGVESGIGASCEGQRVLAGHLNRRAKWPFPLLDFCTLHEAQSTRCDG